MAQYDAIASLYDEQMGDFGDLHHQQLFNPPLLNLLPKNSQAVLDLGSGNGYWANILAKKYTNVTAIDHSEKLLRIAREKRPLKNITYTCVDLEDTLPYQNTTFDFIFSNMVFHYIKHIDKLAKELYRVLKKDGTLLFSITHPLYELQRAKHLHFAQERTKYSVVALNQSIQIDVYYEPYAAFIKHFKNAGFEKIHEEEIIITDAFTHEYPKYKQFIGFPRAYILKFKK